MTIPCPVMTWRSNGFMIHVVDLTLRWRHNGGDGVSNHQPHHCLLKRLFRRRSKKTSKLRVTGLCAGNSPGPVNSPHKWPVTWKMSPFDDVIMICPEFSGFSTRKGLHFMASFNLDGLCVFIYISFWILVVFDNCQEFIYNYFFEAI